MQDFVEYYFGALFSPENKDILEFFKRKKNRGEQNLEELVILKKLEYLTSEEEIPQELIDLLAKIDGRNKRKTSLARVSPAPKKQKLSTDPELEELCDKLKIQIVDRRILYLNNIQRYNCISYR